jgi:hypothetical protein
MEYAGRLPGDGLDRRFFGVAAADLFVVTEIPGGGFGTLGLPLVSVHQQSNLGFPCPVTPPFPKG